MPAPPWRVGQIPNPDGFNGRVPKQSYDLRDLTLQLDVSEFDVTESKELAEESEGSKSQ